MAQMLVALILILTLSGCATAPPASEEPPFARTSTPEEAVNMQWSKISQPGRMTPWNEDEVLVDDERRIMVLADGMGANGAAAAMLVGAIEAREDGDFVAAIREANTTIFETAQSDTAKRGMAASVLAVGITADTAYVAHVGDTRLYRLREGVFEAVTRDHILGNEPLPGAAAGATSKMPRAARTREVGARAEVDIELSVVPLQQGDRLLLCTQGVHKVISKERLGEVLGSDAPAPEKAKTLAADVVAASAPYDASLIIVEL